MTRRLRISADAEAEMANASRWYERRRSGLGADFLRAIDRAVNRIRNTRHVGTPVPGIADTEIRRIRVARFPYHVVYVELPDRAHVLAVAHHRRHPTYWLHRIRP